MAMVMMTAMWVITTAAVMTVMTMSYDSGKTALVEVVLIDKILHEEERSLYEKFLLYKLVDKMIEHIG